MCYNRVAHIDNGQGLLGAMNQMESGIKAAGTLKWLAWVSTIIGFVLLLIHVSDFRAENFGLMAAIGFLIGGMNIFLLSTVFRLLHTES
jgi:hypothetical protein